MRLVSIAQKGDAVSADVLAATASSFLPPPNFANVPAPPPSLMSPGPAMSQPDLMVAGKYAFTPEEKTRYAAVFANQDGDKDGFVTGQEAVALFSQSGLDRDGLRTVWTLADVDKDNKLNIEEFTIAMHLIVCATKRNIPVPTELPPAVDP